MIGNGVFGRKAGPARQWGLHRCTPSFGPGNGWHSQSLSPDQNTLMPGYDRSLDVTVAIEHVAQNLLQPGEWRLAGNVIGRSNLLFRNQCERLTHGLGGVVERSLERDLRVVQAIGIKSDLGSSSTSAKKVHRAALADHIDRPLPRFGAAHSFDDDVPATLFRR